MNWRTRQSLWLRRAWKLCRPRYSLAAAVGRVRFAARHGGQALTGHVVGAHLAFGDHARFDSAEYERQLKEPF
jgi:hypothetical protein